VSELPHPPGQAVNARVSLKALMDAEYRVNQYPYRTLNGWQVYQAVDVERDFAERGKVPAWHFWAAYWDLIEPVVTGETLDELVEAVRDRQDQMYARLPVPFRNRRILAVQLGWPDGVLDECEELEARFPTWTVSWRAEVGYLARLDVPLHRCELAAKDPDELAVQMDQVPTEHDYGLRGCAWCLSKL
jgi:hypothetical protein